VPGGLVAVGEVGLAGEVRRVSGVQRRLAEAERMGFRRAIVPAGSGGLPRSAGPRSAGPRSAGPRSTGARSTGPRSAGLRSIGPGGAGSQDAGPVGAGQGNSQSAPIDVQEVETVREAIALAFGG
jgi:hypothetical protein